MSANTTLSLANDFDNIIAIKEASGDMEQIMQILRDKLDNFKVLSGDDALTLPMIFMGAEGVILYKLWHSLKNFLRWYVWLGW